MSRETTYIVNDPTKTIDKIVKMTYPSFVFPKAVSLIMLLRKLRRKMTTGIAAITREQDRHIHISAAVGKSVFHAAQ